MKSEKKKRLLASIFCDKAILQQNQPIKLWGFTTANTELSVKFLKTTNKTDIAHTTTSNQDGNWEIILPAVSAGDSYELQVSDGTHSITVKDILIGEVWVCSGQSNMQLPMQRAKHSCPPEVFKIENSEIRQFIVPIEFNFHEEQDDFAESEWTCVSPEHTANFSAAGFFLAQKLYEELKVPIGIILSAVGGTPIQSWMSREALQEFPEELAFTNKCQNDRYVREIQDSEQRTSDEWYKFLDKSDIGLQEQWFTPEYNDSGWKDIKLSDSWTENPDLQACGSIWLRFTVDIPEELAHIPTKLFLGCVIDADHVYVNGELVGNITYRYPPREYDVKNLKAGRNVIAVRVIAYNGTGGFVKGKTHKLCWGNKEIMLDGIWKYKRAVTCEAILPTTWFNNVPTGLYNQMLAPLHRYAVKGVAWYQGESNTGSPQKYYEYFNAMVANWRKRWNESKLPFIFVQLANYIPDPCEYSWAVLREEQRKSLAIEDTAMVVAIDVGEYNDLHPINKKAIGERLALAALKTAYDFDIVHSGPLFESVATTDDKLILNFDLVGSGLTTRNNENLEGFEICINDKFIPAQAVLEGDCVVIHSAETKNISAVRYAWSDSPDDANLLNKEGLPASPFMYDFLEKK